jgi:hypothetical protein
MLADVRGQTVNHDREVHSAMLQLSRQQTGRELVVPGPAAARVRTTKRAGFAFSHERVATFTCYRTRRA